MTKKSNISLSNQSQERVVLLALQDFVSCVYHEKVKTRRKNWSSS